MTNDLLTQRPPVICCVVAQALVYALVTAALSGALLAMHYVPTPTSAALSLEYIQGHVFAGTVLRRLHSTSAFLGLVFAPACVLALLLGHGRNGRWDGLLASIAVVLTVCVQYVLARALVGDKSSMEFLRLMCRDAPGPSTVSSASSPDLLTRLFARTYVTHILILPAVVLATLGRWRTNGFSLLAVLRVSPVPLWRGLVGFVAALSVVGITMGPLPSPVLEYSMDQTSHVVPWYAHSLAWVASHLSFPLVTAALVVVLLAAALLGAATRRRRSL